MKSLNIQDKILFKSKLSVNFLFQPQCFVLRCMLNLISNKTIAVDMKELPHQEHSLNETYSPFLINRI